MSGKPLLIVDGHLDMALNGLFNRRDLTQPVHVLREREDPGGARGPDHPDSLRERSTVRGRPQGAAVVALPEMRQGRVGMMLATVMARVDLQQFAQRTQAAAHAVGQSHLHYYRALERQGEIAWIRSTAELEACVQAWVAPGPDTPVGLILSMESADPILGPDQVQAWWDNGLRSVSLTHFGANTWGHGTGTEGGLYACAHPLMDALRAAGVALDLSHASDQTFWQIMDYWDGPVHASHCMCRALVPSQRHLSDEMIRALAGRGGVIGMVFAEPMLDSRWTYEDPATHHPVARRAMVAVIDHVDHICQLTGSCDHVAIGSDLDGGFGRELAPTDCETIADLQRFPGMLARRGYTEENIAAIAHGNLLRFFRQAWSGT